MTIAVQADPVYEAPDDLVERLGAAANERTIELQDQRRIPADLYSAASMLFRQLVPADLCGEQRSPLDWFRTGIELARNEASFGWVVTQGAAELAWIAAGADPSWAAEVLQDPLATSASTTAGIGSLIPVEDGYRFSGRWSFNTGCQNATWIGGSALIEGSDGDKPRIRWAWVPADRAELIDDWNPSGLRGTGSHSVAIASQHVPAEWTFNPFSTTQNDRGAYRCVVGNGNWPIATSVAATQLGNARRALDEAASIVEHRATFPDFVPLIRNPTVQRTLVESEGRWQAAIASVERELERMWSEASVHEELTIDQRIRLHRANSTASQLAVSIVDAAVDMCGTASISYTHILNRYQRDAHALRGHVAVNGASLEQNARLAAALETPTTAVLV